MQIIPRKAVAKRFGVSDVTLWRLIKAGKFPAPIKISAGRVGFLESDIEKFFAGLVRTDGSAAFPETRTA
jgi:predicted DNA-binding transcriptional regulator AlpA